MRLHPAEVHLVQHNGRVEQVKLISDSTTLCCSLKYTFLLIAMQSLLCTALFYIALIFYWTALYCNGSTVHYCVRLIRGYKTFTVVPTSNGSAVPTAC